MNFFDAQDQARRTTRRLVFLYMLATLLIVIGVTSLVGVALFGTTEMIYEETIAGFSNQEAVRSEAIANFLAQKTAVLVSTAVLTVLFIMGATLYKTSRLSSGGGRVAQDLGGTLVSSDTRDPLRRRLRNVVEEMSIASGVPVPDIYVLEEESSINAFAAGYAPGDAAVAVTRGTLELLDRNELQGVIAHEFSHILNGDMRLNIRLMGVLFGIMVLGIIGRMIIRGGYHANIMSNRSDRVAPVAVIVGLGLAILGGIGVFMARIIKAGVSRQREYLADASAVQFTRQSTGLASALKKIGGYTEGSYLRSTDPEEVSHMLFGTGAKFSSMLATHPPLTDRIRALDPSFKEGDYPAVDARYGQIVTDHAPTGPDLGVTSAFASGSAVAIAESIADMVGQPENEHVEYAGHLRYSIPEMLYDAAHSSELAYLLVIALVLDKSGKNVDRQLSLANERLGRRRTDMLRRFYDELDSSGAEYRLPLLEISFPALKLRPNAQLTFLVELAGRMIEIDGEIDLYEYCFYRILMRNLGQAIDPSGRRGSLRTSRKVLRSAVVTLLSVIARYGHDNDTERSDAYLAGITLFGAWARDTIYRPDIDYSVSLLDESVDVVLNLNSKGRQTLIRAISAVVLFDGQLTVTETELVRAICASLDCPLPPILVQEMRK